MDTTRNTRADRIHRWMRATGNFREASARYDMANAAFDEAAPLSAALARAEINTVLGGIAHA